MITEFMRQHSPVLAGLAPQAVGAPLVDGITLTVRDDDDPSLVHRTLHGLIVVAPWTLRRGRTGAMTRGLYVVWAKSPVHPIRLRRPKPRPGAPSPSDGVAVAPNPEAQHDDRS